VRPLRPVGRDVVRRLRGHDVALYTAGLTFYGGIAVLPTGLLAVWVAGLVLGEDRTARLGDSLADALPDAVGAPDTVRAIADAGAGLGWMTALVALVPASLYGEGLRRAFVRLEEEDESHPGRRGRLGVLPLLAATPLLAVVVLLCAPFFADLAGGGAGSRAVAAYLALCLGWVLLTGPMAYVYRVLSPRTPGWRPALLAGTTAAAFVAGFLQGFVLFLAIPLDLGRPFGGFGAVGACVAVVLWLWVLHLVVLVGYALSRTLDSPATPAAGDRQARLVLRG
jgi:membrane protein